MQKMPVQRRAEELPYDDEVTDIVGYCVSRSLCFLYTRCSSGLNEACFITACTAKNI
jgi:hypothetical protein